MMHNGTLCLQQYAHTCGGAQRPSCSCASTSEGDRQRMTCATHVSHSQGLVPSLWGGGVKHSGTG